MPRATGAHLYQVKVTLERIKPPIWRRLLVSSTTSLWEFHDILQTAMGWTDSHLHMFESRGEFYGAPDDELVDSMNNEEHVRLDKVLIGEKDTLRYEYDFGDGWKHKIVLEKILPYAESVVVPSCTGGKRACPPEDCGGVWGYLEILDAIRDPAHPEHKDTLDLVGDSFDPEHFDVAEVNEVLASRHHSA